MYSMYNYAMDSARERYARIYAEFWMWSKANGYDIAMGNMKEAWSKFQEDELGQRYKSLFNSSISEEVKTEFNAYCAERIRQEREFIQNATKKEKSK